MELWDILNENGEITGKSIVRGEELNVGEYHLVVHIWIKDRKNKFLIQKRADYLKLWSGIWATTGGCATKGENSLISAQRELKEELGIYIPEQKFRFISRIKRKNDFTDIWMINEDILLDDIVIQKEEVSEVKYVTKEDIFKMTLDGIFFNYGEEYYKLIFA